MSSTLRSLDLIYSGGAAHRWRELEAFRSQAQLSSSVQKGLVYRTWSLGEGDCAAVFLPGGMGHGEVWFPQMLSLQRSFRTVAVSLPECKSLEQAAEGVIETLREMGIARYILVGYSLGGLVAQLMLRMDPENVLGAALCLTGAPCQGLSSENLEKWKNRGAQALRMKMTNFSRVARLTMAQNAFNVNCPEELRGGMDFWRAFIEDTYFNYLYKKQYVNLNYVAQPALYASCPLQEGDMRGWKGKVLILHSPQDALYAQETPALLSLYPGARAEEYSGGQFAILLNEQAATRSIEEFCKACAASK